MRARRKEKPVESPPLWCSFSALFLSPTTTSSQLENWILKNRVFFNVRKMVCPYAESFGPLNCTTSYVLKKLMLPKSRKCIRHKGTLFFGTKISGPDQSTLNPYNASEVVAQYRHHIPLCIWPSSNLLVFVE